MFGFENSNFLYALTLIIIPIIIHLFGIKRPIREVFAPLPIILKIRSRVIKKKRLHSLVLILLRMLLFAFVTIAFAGMFIISTAKKDVANNKCMFIVDNSPSVRARAGGKTVLEYLAYAMEDYVIKNEGLCRVNTIYTLSDRANFDMDADELKKRDWIKSISTGKKANHMVEELKEVISLYRDKSYERVVLFSDMYSHFVGDVSKAKEFTKSQDIEIISPQFPSVSNAFIEQVRFEKGEGSVFKAIVNVENGGELPFYGNLQFYDGEKLLTTESINLAAGTKSEIEFNFQSQMDGNREYLFWFRIEGDDFEYDNNEYVYFRESKKGNVLLVNGEPSSDESKSEIFYLKNAILSYFGENLQLFTVLEDMLPDIPELYDVIVLSNVNMIDEFKLGLLSQYITDGGKLLITLGSKTSISGYNNVPFMPAKIKNLIDVDTSETVQMSNNLFFDATIGFSQSLSRVRVMKLFDVTLYPESIEILRSSSGKPLLILKNFGKGSVLLYTTSIDMDMNDFPIRKNFVPFISLLFEKMLSGLSDKKVIYARPEEEISVGVVSCEENNVVIIGKKSTQQKAVCRAQADGLAILRFRSPDDTGFYNITYGKSYILLIVNADKDESILKRTKYEEIVELKKLSQGSKELSPLNVFRSGNMSLVELILLLSALVLIFEMFVMNRR